MLLVLLFEPVKLLLGRKLGEEVGLAGFELSVVGVVDPEGETEDVFENDDESNDLPMSVDGGIYDIVPGEVLEWVKVIGEGVEAEDLDLIDFHLVEEGEETDPVFGCCAEGGGEDGVVEVDGLDGVGGARFNGVDKPSCGECVLGGEEVRDCDPWKFVLKFDGLVGEGVEDCVIPIGVRVWRWERDKQETMGEK